MVVVVWVKVIRVARYLELAQQILNERIFLLDYHLTRFGRQVCGMLFFYVSSLDQNSHMFWRVRDRKHPLYDEELRKRFGDTLKEFYAKADLMLGMVLE